MIADEDNQTGISPYIPNNQKKQYRKALLVHCFGNYTTEVRKSFFKS